MKVPEQTRQGNKLEKALKYFMRPTPEFVDGWEYDKGRKAGTRVVFDPKQLKYVCI